MIDVDNSVPFMNGDEGKDAYMLVASRWFQSLIPFHEWINTAQELSFLQCSHNVLPWIRMKHLV